LDRQLFTPSTMDPSLPGQGDGLSVRQLQKVKQRIPYPASARFPGKDGGRRRRKRGRPLPVHFQPGPPDLRRTPIYRLPPTAAETIEEAPLAKADQGNPKPCLGEGMGSFPFPHVPFRTHPFPHVKQEKVHPFPLRRRPPPEKGSQV